MGQAGVLATRPHLGQALGTAVSSELGTGRLGPPAWPAWGSLVTFFMKTVSCREHLSTLSFRTEMSLRVLAGLEGTP